MIYARAGVSWAKFAVKGSSELSLLEGTIEPFPSSSLDSSDTLTGWKIALGGSTRFTSNLVGSIEGAYADYGSISDAFGKSKDLTPDANCHGLAGTTADAVKGDLTEWTVKAKLTYQITD
jgi:opacity protein-like surface antigen